MYTPGHRRAARRRAGVNYRVRATTALGALATLALGASAGAAVAPPDQWGFEQVTPVNKGGGNVQSIDTFQTRVDGQAFLLSASGAFDGVSTESVPLYTRYLARRTDAGWVNRGVDVPFDPIPPAIYSAVASVIATSEDLAFAVVSSTRVLAPGATDGGSNVYLREMATGAYRLVATHPSKLLTQNLTGPGGAGNIKYVSNDGKTVVFVSALPLIDGVPEGTNGAAMAYRWTEARGLELVSRLPDDEGGGPVFPSTVVGYGSEGGPRQSLPRSNGGSTIYFSTSVQESPGPAYRWSEGDVSVISKSQIAGDDSPPAVADVLATTSNSDYTLIRTRSAVRLSDDAPTFEPGSPERDTEVVLYRYARATGKLTYVGVGDLATFQESEVAEQMSDDGRTVVFQTQHQLTPDAAEFFGASDSRNRRNLYVWRDGTLRYVASGDEGRGREFVSGLRLLSENGRYLSFADDSQGTASRFGVSDNTSLKCAASGSSTPELCNQVYVIDLEDPDSLECASCRPGGASPKGESGDPGVVGPGLIRMNGRQVQTVSNDGTAFFSSTEDLVADDSNGLQDVYAYRDGALRVVSEGVQGASARFLDATADGSSIFFATNAQLAETDTDRSVDVYVTRLGAGYPDVRPVVPPICQGGDCRPSDPPNDQGLPPAGGGSEASPGGFQASTKTVKARVRITGVVRRKGSLRVTVRATSAGQLRISGAQVTTTIRNPRRAGDFTVSVPLSKKARTTIQRGGRLRARIRVSLTPPFGSPAKSTSTRTVR